MSRRVRVRSAVAETSKDVRQTWSVVKAGLRGLSRSRLPQMAAALSFRTLFALIPVLVLSLVVLQAFVGPQDISNLLRKTLQYTGIQQLVLELEPEDGTADASETGEASEQELTSAGETGTASDTQEPDADEIADPPTVQIKQPATDEPDLAEAEQPPADTEASQSESGFTIAADSTELRLDEWIEDRVENILAIRFETFGALGVLIVLIYAAISMLVEIERTFNQIYRAQVGRSWLRRVPQYWTLLTLSVLVIVGAFYVGERFEDIAGNVLGGAIGFVVQSSFTALLLAFAYTVMPNTKVALRAAGAGALVAAVCWEIAKTGFRAYLDFATTYPTLYGSIALPLFAMLWMYLTWLLILFGLQVAFGIQHIGTWMEAEQSQDDPMLHDPIAALPLVVSVAEQFYKGKPTTTSQAAADAGLPESVAVELLERLVIDGLLHHVEDDAYTLARPPEDIKASDVLASAHAATPVVAGEHAAGLVGKLRSCTSEAAEAMSIDQLCEPRRKKTKGSKKSNDDASGS